MADGTQWVVFRILIWEGANKPLQNITQCKVRLEKHRIGWEDNIKMYHEKTFYGMDSRDPQ
jgi:hypothetical protein